MLLIVSTTWSGPTQSPWSGGSRKNAFPALDQPWSKELLPSQDRIRSGRRSETAASSGADGGSGIGGPTVSTCPPAPMRGRRRSSAALGVSRWVRAEAGARPESSASGSVAPRCCSATVVTPSNGGAPPVLGAAPVGTAASEPATTVDATTNTSSRRLVTVHPSPVSPEAGPPVNLSLGVPGGYQPNGGPRGRETAGRESPLRS